MNEYNLISENENNNAASILRSKQEEALIQCGYNELDSFTNEELRDFIQAESLKTLLILKKIAFGFVFMALASLFILIITIMF